MYRNVPRRVRVYRQTGKWIGRTVVLLALTLATCFVTSRHACTTSAAPQAGGGGGYPRAPQSGFKRSSIDQRVERLARQLNLNEVQRLHVKKLLERHQAEVNRLWDDQVISPIDRVSKLRLLHEDIRQQFHALLNEEQRKKYEQLLQQGAHQNRLSSKTTSMCTEQRGRIAHRWGESMRKKQA